MMTHKEAGQSTVEFIFTFAFGVSIILVIFNSAMTYTTGYLVHYATFMASRTYLTAETYSGTFGYSSGQKAELAARETFNKYNLGIFGINPGDFHINPAHNGTPSDYITVGVYTSFEKDIDTVGKLAGQSKLSLVSESFLGKEPTRGVCAERVCHAITNQEVCNGTMDITLFDDGC